MEFARIVGAKGKWKKKKKNNNKQNNSPKLKTCLYTDKEFSISV
jgi:hypothetical protein